MRPSPPKVVFNYPQNHNQRPYYEPKVIQSGFIVGEAVGYTPSPHLPNNYQSFSPSRSRPRATTSFITS